MPPVLFDQTASSDPGSLPTTYCISPFDAAKNVVLFFVLHVFAHGFTILPTPGQKLEQSIVMVAAVVLSPVLARSLYNHALWKMFSAWWRRFRNLSRPGMTFWEQLKFVLWGEGEGQWPLQVAIDVGAVAVPLQPALSSAYAQEMRNWKQLDLKSLWVRRDALYMDGTGVGEDEDIRIVPAGTMTSSSRDLNVKPSSSLLQMFLGIVQLCYTLYVMYLDEWSQLSAKGLSSPYIIAIPYVVMSLVSLVIIGVVGTYPCVTVLRPSRAPHSGEKVEAKVTGVSEFAPSPSNDETPSESGSSHEPGLSFAYWFCLQFELELGGSELFSYTSLIHLLISYLMITVIIICVTGLRYDDPFLAAGFLLWIYGGLLQYPMVVLFSKAKAAVAVGSGGSFGQRLIMMVILSAMFTGAALVAVGPLCLGVYGAARQLWMYDSQCRPALEFTPRIL